jgi:hypothetical protein
MTYTELSDADAAERACQEEGLLEALVWIIEWEVDRAKEAGHDHRFGMCIQSVMHRWCESPYRRAANAIIADLNDRRGLGLVAVDEETVKEIGNTWAFLIKKYVDRDQAP